MLIIARIIIPNRRLSKEAILIELARSTSMSILCPFFVWRVTICLLLSNMILLNAIITYYIYDVKDDL
jgi:hypothetical protein